MGADASIELKSPFEEVSKWPKGRVQSVTSNYIDGEYDFGLDSSAVMSITGCEMDEAKSLMSALTKSDVGIVNAVTLLIVILAIGNSENRDEVHRLENIFDLLDFNQAKKISFDEMTILLLCAHSAFSFILEGRLSEERQQLEVQSVMQVAKNIYESLQKKSNNHISKEEFCLWVKENLFSAGIIHINDILQALTTTIGTSN